MNDIAVVLPVRKNSKRIENKMLRLFASSNLYEICLGKLAELKRRYGMDVYIAAYEPEFLVGAKAVGLDMLVRTEESANSEVDPDAYDFLNNIDHEWVCMMSACHPILSINTMRLFYERLEAGTLISDSRFVGLVSVTRLARWVWKVLPNTGPYNLNAGDGNSKSMNCLFPSANAMLAFRRETYLSPPYRYWPVGEPDLFVIEDDVEVMDVDTPGQFKAVEAVYKRFTCHWH